MSRRKPSDVFLTPLLLTATKFVADILEILFAVFEVEQLF